MPQHLGQLVSIAHERGWPMPSAIVVNKGDLETGKLEGSSREGFLAAAESVGSKVDHPDEFLRDQQEKVFAWAKSAPESLELSDEEDAIQRGGGSRFVAYMRPVLEALRALGGQGRPKDVCDWIRQHEDVPESEITTTRKSGQTVFENRVAWARLNLIKAGYLDGRERGVWLLTAKGGEADLTDEEAHNFVKELRKRFRIDDEAEDAPAPEIETAVSLFDDPERQFWFAGALWGDSDQTERFVNEGIWQSGYKEKYSE